MNDLLSFQRKVEYLVKNSDQQREALYVYSFENYPKELEKKVLLLKHFRNYLLEGDKKEDDLWKVKLFIKDFFLIK